MKDFPVRHLAYIVLPVAHNGLWQANLGMLKRRWHLFTGRKTICIIKQGPGTQYRLDSPGAVVDFMGDVDCEFVYANNDKSLREVVAWEPLFSKLSMPQQENEAIFFGHAKGVSYTPDRDSTLLAWLDILYRSSLDYWPLVEKQLGEFPITGSFKKVGPGMFAKSASSWHYSGTFYWLNARAFYSQSWREIDREWFGTESWPGIHFDAKQGGLLFMEGTAELDCYHANQMEKRILPAWADWRKKHRFMEQTWTYDSSKTPTLTGS